MKYIVKFLLASLFWVLYFIWELKPLPGFWKVVTKDSDNDNDYDYYPY